MAGVGNNLPIWYLGADIDGRRAAAFVGMLTSLTFDFSARHKVGGTHLNFFIAQQLPVLRPSDFSHKDLDFITPRVLELTYTSRAMRPWAEDLGYFGDPFGWDDDRRAQLRAELDAFFAKKYGLSEDDLRYVLDPAKVKGSDYPSETFRGLKEKEIRLYGEYRTERLVLEAWQRMEGSQRPYTLPASVELPPLEDLPNGAWAWTHGLDERDRVRAQLRAMVGILPSAADAPRIRLATLACLNPRLLGDFLSSADRAAWQRIVGQQARPNESVATLTPPTNAAWGAAYNELVSAAILDVSADGSKWSAGPRLDRSTLHVDDPAVGRALFAWSRLQSVDLEQGLTRVSAEIIPFIREGRLAA